MDPVYYPALMIDWGSVELLGHPSASETEGGEGREEERREGEREGGREGRREERRGVGGEGTGGRASLLSPETQTTHTTHLPHH